MIPLSIRVYPCSSVAQQFSGAGDLVFDLLEKPCSGAEPMPVDAALADADGFGGLFVGHAPEKFEHHHARALGMHDFQLFQRRVDQKDLFVVGGGGEIEALDVE